MNVHRNAEKSFDEMQQRTHDFWAGALQASRLGYPSEHVVRFLAAASRERTTGGEGLDIGFGSGQYLALLMDFGYRASGVELIDDAVQAALRRFKNNHLLGELLQSDLREITQWREHFDVAVAWGVFFLRPLPDMQQDLADVFRLLKPGGRLCLNFRTPDNWFCGLGKELSPGHFLLDDRAGSYANALYTFLDEDQARHCVTGAGFEILNFERYDWTRNQMKEQHSWWIVWAQRPDGQSQRE